MIIIAIIAGAAVLIAALYLLGLYPGRERKGILSPFLGRYVAHRGLFDNNNGPRENSMEAFEKAIENGYGIELDIQLSRDGTLVVFHDETLLRMCKNAKRVTDLTAEELSSFTLGEGRERIPLFSDVLKKVSGRVPLLIEIKPHGDCVETARKAACLLKDYKGDYGIQSFHPGPLLWYRKNCPEVPRGILSTDYRRNKMDRPWYQQFLLSNLLVNFAVKPDYIAYNHKYADQFSFRLGRRLYKYKCAAWTVRTQKALDEARKSFDIFIFDSFIPKE